MFKERDKQKALMSSMLVCTYKHSYSESKAEACRAGGQPEAPVNLTSRHSVFTFVYLRTSFTLATSQSPNIILPKVKQNEGIVHAAVTRVGS